MIILFIEDEEISLKDSSSDLSIPEERNTPNIPYAKCIFRNGQYSEDTNRESHSITHDDVSNVWTVVSCRT